LPLLFNFALEYDIKSYRIRLIWSWMGYMRYCSMQMVLICWW
jgi:hypothetical protein